MLSDGVQEKFRLFIKPHFDQFLSEIKYFGDFDYNRITVWADIDMYNWKEDAFVWGQKREKASKTFQVFFDSKLVCYLNEHEDKDKTLRNFWKGFLEAYEKPHGDSSKIYINKSTYDEVDKQNKKKQKESKEKQIKNIKSKEASTPLQKEAKELALHVAKESSPST